MKGYPRTFLPALIGTFALVLVSGCLLAPTTLVMRLDMSLPWRLPGDGRVWCAAAHAAGSFALTMLTGALWSIHMRAGWRRRKQRGSGAVLLALLLALLITALVIYYASSETLGQWAALAHLGLGAALTLPFTWHWLHGRQAADRAHAMKTAGTHVAVSTQHGPTAARI